jgi:hypothetical protein
MVFVWGLVVTLLSYVLCSALNPKASLQFTFTPGYPFASGVEIAYSDESGHLFRFVSDTDPTISDSCRSEATLGREQ